VDRGGNDLFIADLHRVCPRQKKKSSAVVSRKRQKPRWAYCTSLEDFFIKLCTAPPLISVFLSLEPAVLFLKSRPAPSLISAFFPRPRHFNLLISTFRLAGVAERKHEWHKSATIVYTKWKMVVDIFIFSWCILFAIVYWLKNTNNQHLNFSNCFEQFWFKVKISFPFIH
jgi:hypothetical protein